MKNFQAFTFLFLLFIIPRFCQGQLWKQYADSAKAFIEQKNTDKAIEYYSKARQELQRDSTLTNTYAGICNSLAKLYRDGDNKKAEPLYLEARQIREKVLGKEHPDYAQSCNNLATFYEDMGQYEKAESLYMEAMQIRKKVMGKEHPDYAQSCNNLGVLYTITGQYEKAEPFYLEARQIREKIPGKESPEYSKTIGTLGILYVYMGQYKKAEPLFLENMQLDEKVFGKDHPEYAHSCEALANLYFEMGQYKSAESLFWEVRKIREKALGKEHLDYSISCNNLGNLYMQTGQYSKSESFYLEDKQILENIVGKEHPDYAANINNLALLYRQMGQYGKAEPLYLEARQITKKVLGEKHPRYAGSISNLGIFYGEMGQYAKEELLYVEAKQINEKVLGKDHPDYAASCNNLGGVYLKMGQYDTSELLYLEAKKIREKVLGKEHPDYAESLNNLGVLYLTTGQYEKAEQLYSETKQINEKIFGKEHPDYAQSCSNLGTLYMKMGRYEKAELLCHEAKQIRERILGKEHPDYARSCYDLVTLYWNMENPRKAIEMYAEAFTVQKNQLSKIFQFTSEAEKQSYVKKYSDHNNHFFTFATSYYSNTLQGLAYDVSLSQRNIILSSSRQLRNTIYLTPDTIIKNKYAAWIDIKEQLALWYVKPASVRPAYVPDLETEANTLEKELTRFSNSFKETQQTITWKQILQQLKPDEAAVEFVKYKYYGSRNVTDSIFYIALLLRKDKDEPFLIPLFESRVIEKLLKAGNTLNTVSAFYRSNDKGNNAFHHIWRPIEKHLEGIRRIYYAPAGVLHRISFAALPLNDHQVLSDKYQLVQLNTTASVISQSDGMISTYDSISLYGAIQYDADSSALRQSVAVFNTGDEQATFFRDENTKTSSWKYLPGTEKEISGIRSLAKQKGYPVSFSEGITASEESAKALNGNRSPSVLHIATHGFFFPDPKEDKKNSTGKLTDGGGSTFKLADNPLFRSGLLFAGANNAWKGKHFKGIEDGILTAYEVANLYLPNTKLVVLSACETGLGDVQGNEGVYGLQRAFKIAGVENLVMSLWKVPDKTTAEFMQEFYKGIFDELSINDAFYHAQTSMKNRYRKEPYKWAAWVLVR